MSAVRGLVIAALALAGSHAARSAATSRQEVDQAGHPALFAPSPTSAPFLSLGYREAAAGLLYVRLIGYLNSEGSTAAGLGDLATAIVELDPYFQRVYENAANAMTLVSGGSEPAALLRAIDLLDRGMKLFPSDWRLPLLAAQIYMVDLKTEDTVTRREWDERAARLLETAVRKPGAPADAAAWATTLRTKLGQRERAMAGVRELLLVTDNAATKARLIKTLEKLEASDADAIAAEIYAERRIFEQQWQSGRPSVSRTMYILVGPRITPGFDMTDLATGGRDLFVEATEPLEELAP